MANTTKKPARGTSESPRKAEKKLRQVQDTDLSSVIGGKTYYDPCNNTFD